MKILAIFTGGTISCSERDGMLSPDGSNSYLLLNSRADVCFDTAAPYTILSENLGERELTLLGDTVEENLKKDYDGIVIAHGTDTLQYSAAYLALRLGLSKIPVVLVAAAYPLSDSRSNGYANFSASVDFIAAKQGRGVFVSYKNSGDDRVAIHRGSELLPHAAYSDELNSMSGNEYGFVFQGRFVPNTEYVEHCTVTGCNSRLNGHVLWLKAHPGMIYPDNLDGVKSVLLEGYHSGTLATNSAELKAFCQTAEQRKIPVYLTGCDSGFPYESKLLFDELKITVLPKMSPVTAYMRLWLS